MKPAVTHKALESAVQKAVLAGDESMRALASRTGVSATHLQYLKTGQRRLGLETLMRLADYYGLPYRFEGPKPFKKP